MLGIKGEICVGNVCGLKKGRLGVQRPMQECRWVGGNTVVWAQ